MSHSRNPVEMLTSDEAAKVRAIAAEKGVEEAAKAFGLKSDTLRKAALGLEPVGRQTATIIRLRLTL